MVNTAPLLPTVSPTHVTHTNDHTNSATTHWLSDKNKIRLATNIYEMGVLIASISEMDFQSHYDYVQITTVSLVPIKSACHFHTLKN